MQDWTFFTFATFKDNIPVQNPHYLQKKIVFFTFNTHNDQTKLFSAGFITTLHVLPIYSKERKRGHLLYNTLSLALSLCAELYPQQQKTFRTKQISSYLKQPM